MTTPPDVPARLHNSGVPPRTTISWSGLGRLVDVKGPGGSGVGGVRVRPEATFGTPVAFALPEPLHAKTPAQILRALGHRPGRTPVATLLALIEARAADLPIPDACAVVPATPSFPRPWPDPLAALAVLTKSSAAVWLRAKSPLLGVLAERRAVALLFPPAFPLPEESAP